MIPIIGDFFPKNRRNTLFVEYISTDSGGFTSLYRYPMPMKPVQTKDQISSRKTQKSDPDENLTDPNL
jgi:hypothetical protein